MNDKEKYTEQNQPAQQADQPTAPHEAHPKRGGPDKKPFQEAPNAPPAAPDKGKK